MGRKRGRGEKRLAQSNFRRFRFDHQGAQDFFKFFDHYITRQIRAHGPDDLRIVQFNGFAKGFCTRRIRALSASRRQTAMAV